MVGVMVGSAAMIIALSVLNGFDEMLTSYFNDFDPDIKVTSVKGKNFPENTVKLEDLLKVEGLENVSSVLEENALFKYRKKEHVAIIKGVDEHYAHTNGIDSLMVEGQFELTDQMGQQFCAVGRGVAHILGLRLNFMDPVHVYVPRRKGKITNDITKAFRKDYFFPSGIFKVNLSYDETDIILPIASVRKLLEYTNEVSSLHISVKEGYDIDDVQKEVKELFGTEFKVANRMQQNESLYKVFQTEKFFSFIILTFILIIFSFNLVGSLTMLILEKKDNISTLKSLGADAKMINQIFLFEGWLISLIGVVLGLVFGFILCSIQIKFGVLKLVEGSFLVDAYPVALELNDFLVTFATVAFLGWISAFVPIRFINKRKVFIDD